MQPITIDSLLRQRQARRSGRKSSAEAARSRLDQSKYLADNFATYDKLRAHLFHPRDFPYIQSPEYSDAVASTLEGLSWIERTGANTWALTANGEIRTYLSGGWLEEYAFLAVEAVGADEAYYGQEIEWQVDNVKGKNEIDVIARRGSVLSFISCKTIQVNKSQGHMAQLRGFVTETNYWNQHFANDQARALLIVTADFVDELRGNACRYPQLVARASILDVSIASFEDLSWEKLTKAVSDHWGAA